MALPWLEKEWDREWCSDDGSVNYGAIVYTALQVNDGSAVPLATLPPSFTSFSTLPYTKIRNNEKHVCIDTMKKIYFR